MKRALLLAVVVALLLTGCDSDNQAASTETVTTTAPPAAAQGRVYWLRDGRVWPVARELESPAVAASALAALYEGPTVEEQSDLDFTSALPSGVSAPEVAIEDGVARIAVDEALAHAPRPLAQVVYTLTQFPSVDSVEINGKRYTRADFEKLTPAILVESPLPLEDVSSPLRVSGTANTFEATFQYELKDSSGKIVDKNFVTATSGTGTRGTFDFTTQLFDDVGSLVVLELSAKDGSRINEVEIPLRMAN